MKGFLRTLVLSCAASLALSKGVYAMTDAQKQYACDRIMEALEKERTSEAVPTGVATESLEEARELKHYFDMLYYGGSQPIQFFAKSGGECLYELCVSARDGGENAVREHAQAEDKLRLLAEGLFDPSPEKALDNIYRYVIGHVEYSKEVSTPLYTALMEGKTTCAGYAALFERLCSINGISCAVVWGKDHAYNLVRLADQVMVYDPAFDADAGYGTFSKRSLDGLVAWREDYYLPRLVEPSDFPVPLAQKGEAE